MSAATIDSLWAKGQATATGAIVGAAVGGVGSFGFWTWACGAISEGAGCHSWDAVIGLSLAGAAGGALIGTAVGAAIPKWHLRFGRSPPLQATLGVLPRGGLVVSVRYVTGVP